MVDEQTTIPRGAVACPELMRCSKRPTWLHSLSDHVMCATSDDLGAGGRRTYIIHHGKWQSPA